MRIFWFLENMKWNHLPEDGGLNRQHPILVERFRTIFEIRGQHEAAESAKRKNDTMGPRPKNPKGK